jgi:TRAP-type uncharacterized transport system substrate-binding protein
MGSFKEDAKDTVLALVETAHDKWNDGVSFLKETWPFLLLLLIVIFGFIFYWNPPPPKIIMMASGSAGGSYEQLASKYVEYFKKHNVAIELLPTSGSQENIQRLSDRKDPIQAAFVQGGSLHNKTVPGVESLGSVDYEPIWFFYKGSLLKDGRLDKTKLPKVRIAVGPEGSGTHVQAMNILRLNQIENHPFLLPLHNDEAVAALNKGEVDVVIMDDGLRSKNVQALLNDPDVKLFDFLRAAAYTKNIHYLEELMVPMGAFNLARNFPPEDSRMISTVTNLLIDDRMHPAIQFLFLKAAQDINGKESFFAKRGEFPSFKNSEFPESPIAQQFHQRGLPILMDYLPFWIAEFIHRMFFTLVPFFALAYPILISLPGYRLRRIQSKLNRIYGELKFFENQLLVSYDPENLPEYLAKLAEMERKAMALKIPKRAASDFYTLRTSIDYVRNALNRGDHLTLGSDNPT